MGRLFWKLFFAFAAALAVAGLLVSLALSLIWPRAPHGPRPHPVFMAETAAALLEARGPQATRELLEVWRAQGAPLPWVLQADGRDLLGRADVPAPSGQARTVRTDGQDWRVFEARPQDSPPPPGSGGLRLPPPPFLEVVALFIAGLVFSAALAAYLSRPVRHLNRAFDALARGELDARASPLIGRRRDEIADLGLSFDRMAERMQGLLEAQRRLLHDVSHELRSPLARMSAAIGLARQDEARCAAMLQRVEREAERLDALVGELLGLSRLEHDAGRLLPQPLALDVELAARVADARFEADARGVAVETALVPLTVAGHPELLRRVFDNVLRNAVAHAPHASAVALTLQREDAWACVTVRDRGPGVPDSALARIFDPFFRVRPGDASGGAGLGLAIARRAVDAHGGRIEARLPEGGGLQIDIRLPLA